jgi:hypothetical protein
MPCRLCCTMLAGDPTCEPISHTRRFEVDGADAARNFLRHEGPASFRDQRCFQLVCDAIALHTTGSIVVHKESDV